MERLRGGTKVQRTPLVSASSSAMERLAQASSGEARRHFVWRDRGLPHSAHKHGHAFGESAPPLRGQAFGTKGPISWLFPRDAQRDALSAKEASQARSMFALLLARDQKYLCLLEAGESGRMFSSQIPDELKLVAHPVGGADSHNIACLP